MLIQIKSESFIVIEIIDLFASLGKWRSIFEEFSEMATVKMLSESLCC